MYILLIFIPFLTFLIFLTLGRKIGKEGAIMITKIINIIQIIIINIIGYEIIFNENKIEVKIWLLDWDKWIYTDILNNIINIKYDINSILLTELIIIIFTIVINYSIWYLKEDPYLIRFLSKLFLFCFMMLVLVLSNNYIIMLLGWEYVGLTSYLLINYWYTRIQANKASIKAILLNKIGDIGLILGIIIIINNINSNLMRNINTIYYISSKYIIYIILFFILAAFAKSAQIFLHSWLKDAMEAPSPVSALLHAATMVTAGVYIVLRIFPIFNININIYNKNIIYYISIICLLTILIGGLSSLFQYDIKKIIAFSTMSQLGYMFIGNIIGCYNNSYNHLIIHGFFKALLFLSAGIIIHSILNEQDIRKYGNLIYFFPYTYLYFIIGTLAIISWPIYSGFFSKDLLLENTKLSYNLLYFYTLFGALITTIYSIKLIKLVFILPKLPKYSYKYTSLEPNWSLFNYLIILVIGSIFFGYYTKDILLNPIIYENFYPFYSIDFEYIPLLFKIFPLFIISLGILLGIYINNKDFYILKYYNLKYLRYNIKLEQILGSILYFDYLYNLILKKYLFFSYQYIYKYIDKGFLDLFSSLGIYRIFKINQVNPLNLQVQIINQPSLIKQSTSLGSAPLGIIDQSILIKDKYQTKQTYFYCPESGVSFIFLSFFLLLLLYLL